MTRMSSDALQALDRLASGEFRQWTPELEDVLAADAVVGPVVALATGAAEALARGRVDELVEGARRAYHRGRELHPWLAFRGASLLQAAYRFTANGAVMEEAITACTRCGDDLGTPRLAVAARALLGSVHMMAGRLHAAHERCEGGIALAARSGLEGSASAALAHQFRGYVRWEWNKAAEAEADLKHAWSITEPGDRGIRTGVARVLAMLTASEGRVDESRRWLAELEGMVQEPQTQRNREWMAAVRLTLDVVAARSGGTGGGGGLREIDAWLGGWSYRPDELDEWKPAEVRAKLHELDHVLTLLELTGQWESALRTADVVLGAVGEYRDGYRLRAATVRAVALERLARGDEALEAWSDALEIGAPEGFVRSYVEGSAARLDLTLRASKLPGAGDAARRLCSAAPGWCGQAVQSLTPRQTEVLGLMAEGLSNKGIARELEVSVTTVKTHVRDILAALGADSRTHAVATARKLGLVL